MNVTLNKLYNFYYYYDVFLLSNGSKININYRSTANIAEIMRQKYIYFNYFICIDKSYLLQRFAIIQLLKHGNVLFKSLRVMSWT